MVPDVHRLPTRMLTLLPQDIEVVDRLAREVVVLGRVLAVVCPDMYVDTAVAYGPVLAVLTAYLPMDSAIVAGSPRLAAPLLCSSVAQKTISESALSAFLAPGGLLSALPSTNHSHWLSGRVPFVNGYPTTVSTALGVLDTRPDSTVVVILTEDEISGPALPALLQTVDTRLFIVVATAGSPEPLAAVFRGIGIDTSTCAYDDVTEIVARLRARRASKASALVLGTSLSSWAPVPPIVTEEEVMGEIEGRQDHAMPVTRAQSIIRRARVFKRDKISPRLESRRNAECSDCNVPIRVSSKANCVLVAADVLRGAEFVVAVDYALIAPYRAGGGVTRRVYESSNIALSYAVSCAMAGKRVVCILRTKDVPRFDELPVSLTVVVVADCGSLDRVGSSLALGTAMLSGATVHCPADAVQTRKCLEADSDTATVVFLPSGHIPVLTETGTAVCPPSPFLFRFVNSATVLDTPLRGPAPGSEPSVHALLVARIQPVVILCSGSGCTLMAAKAAHVLETRHSLPSIVVCQATLTRKAVEDTVAEVASACPLGVVVVDDTVRPGTLSLLVGSPKKVCVGVVGCPHMLPQGNADDALVLGGVTPGAIVSAALDIRKTTGRGKSAIR